MKARILLEYRGDSSHPGISGDGRFIIFERSNAMRSRRSVDGAEHRAVHRRNRLGRRLSSRHPTDASDKRNDFDLYVATIQTSTMAPMALQKIKRSEGLYVFIHAGKRTLAGSLCVQFFRCSELAQPKYAAN